MQADEKPGKIAAPIKWALGLSAAYVVLFAIALAVQTTTVSPETHSDLLSMKPNELGDLFAGFFAPLAFIWLASTVFIQANELAAQREELAATREEMKANREVSEKNVAFVEAQTDIIKQNYEREIEEGIDRRFAIASERLYSKLRELDSKIYLVPQFGPLETLILIPNDEMPLYAVADDVIKQIDSFMGHVLMTTGFELYAPDNSYSVINGVKKDLSVMNDLYDKVSPEIARDYQDNTLKGLLRAANRLGQIFSHNSTFVDGVIPS